MSERMPKVYVVNQPMIRGGGRAIDVRPAAAFGEVVSVFPPGQPPLDGDHVTRVLNERLADFRAHDFLVLVGHTMLIAAAGAVAARLTGGVVQVLVWDNRDHLYVPVRLRLWDDAFDRPRGGGPVEQRSGELT